MRAFLVGGAVVMILASSVAAAAPSAGGSSVLATRGGVTALAADGDRVALVIRAPYTSGGEVVPCASVVVWEPTRRRVVRLQRPCGPGQDFSLREFTKGVALGGTRAAWLHFAGGNEQEIVGETATLARPTPVGFAWAVSGEGGDGDFAREPVGDGSLIAFTADLRCDADAVLNQGPGAPNQCPPGRKTGYVVAATVWRIGGHGACPGFGGFALARTCTRVASADGELTALAVDVGRIVVRTQSGLTLLTANGAVLQRFDVHAISAALSGSRLAVRTAHAVEVYDTNSGQRTGRFPAASALRLQDLDRDLLVTASGGTVTVRRLGDGHTITIHAGRTALAQLERPGLFVAGARRVTFTPIRDLLRQLGH
jgi:hypothetical protein